MAVKQSYPTIYASSKTLRILKYIAGSGLPVAPAEIEKNMDMKYCTVMTHITTLEQEGLIEKYGDGFIGGFELAKFWAKRKALNDRKKKDIETEDAELGE